MSRSKVGRRPERRPDPHAIKVLADLRERALRDLSDRKQRDREMLAMLVAERDADDR